MAILLMYNIWALIEYGLLTVLMEYNIDILIPRSVLALLLLLIFFPIFVRVLFNNFAQESDKYNKVSSFLVYRKPKAFQGILAGIIYGIPGSVFLVVRDVEFRFKKGKVVEGAHWFNTNNVYRKISPVHIKEAHKLIGTRWSLQNNCFNTFNKFTK